MSILRSARLRAASIVVGYALAACAPAGGQPRTCDAPKATAFRAAGERYRAAHAYTAAVHWFLAATRYSRDCRTSDGAFLSARSLAEAGSTLALGGDYLRALDVLRAARSRLASIPNADRKTADAARAYGDLVNNMISAIDRVAEASM